MNTHEKDGIIYFDKPYICSGVQFGYEHLDCDAIITRESADKDDKDTEIVAYASSKDKNKLLRDIFRTNYGNEDFLILQHIGSWEVTAIV